MDVNEEWKFFGKFTKKKSGGGGSVWGGGVFGLGESGENEELKFL